MLSRLSTLIFMFYSILNGSHSSDTCPSEWPKTDSNWLPGARIEMHGNVCCSLLQIDWDDYDKSRNKEKVFFDYLSEMVCPQLKNGYMDSIYDEFSFAYHYGWAKDVSLEYILWGFFPTHLSFENSTGEVGHLSYPLKYRYITLSKEGKRQLEAEVLIRTSYSKLIAPQELAIFKDIPAATIDDFQKCFSDLNITYEDPLCPHARLIKGKFFVNHCYKTFRQLFNKREKVHVRCLHEAYADCEEKVIMDCHYSAEHDTWYDRYLTIIKKNELPYGRPCSNRTYQEFGAKICEGNCSGEWGSWIGVPSPDCGTYSAVRYRPLQGNIPCYKSSKDCCAERRTITSENRCEDFAYNTTINLKKLKCENSGLLKVGPLKHLMCSCGSDYTGVRCEIDKCNNRCKHGGTCIPHYDSGICICTRGFEGQDCGDKTLTCGQTNECKNGGICEPPTDEKGAYCECEPRYGGLNCEVKAEFCTQDTCSKRGFCYNLTDYDFFKCRCYEGFSGARCEKLVSLMREIGTPQKRSYVHIIVSVGLLIIMVATIIMTIIIVKKKRKRLRQRRFSGELSSTVKHRLNELLFMSVSKLSPAYQSSRNTPPSTIQENVPPKEVLKKSNSPEGKSGGKK